MSASKKSSVISLTGAALLAYIAAGCLTDIGDPVCTPDSVATDKDDKCPYGAPGGPKPELRKDDGNQATCDGIPDPGGGCTYTWIDDAFPAFQQLSCTLNAASCHGVSPGKAQFYFPDADPQTAYDNLIKYVSLTTGKPYLNPATLQDSYILCNLRGEVGKAMPPPEGTSRNDANYQIIASWAYCGAPLTGAGAPP